MKWLKQLFCKHPVNYIVRELYDRELPGGDYYLGSLFVCKKCGKVRLSRGVSVEEVTEIARATLQNMPKGFEGFRLTKREE